MFIKQKKEEKVCVPWPVLGVKSWHQIFINHLTINIELFHNKKKIQHLQQDWYGLCCNKICKSAWCLFNFGNGYQGKWQKLTLTWFLKSPSTMNKLSVFLTSTSPNYRYFWKLDKLQQASFPESRGICGGSLRRSWGRTFESGEEEGSQSQLPLWEHTVISSTHVGALLQGVLLLSVTFIEHNMII